MDSSNSSKYPPSESMLLHPRHFNISELKYCNEWTCTNNLYTLTLKVLHIGARFNINLSVNDINYLNVILIIGFIFCDTYSHYYHLGKPQVF